MSTYTPLSDRVIILPDEAPKVSTGGLFIPESARKKMQKEAHRGVVVAMGEGLRRHAGGRFAMPDVRIGDRVVYDGYAATCKLDDVEHIIVRGDDIACIEEAAS